MKYIDLFYEKIKNKKRLSKKKIKDIHGVLSQNSSLETPPLNELENILISKGFLIWNKESNCYDISDISSYECFDIPTEKHKIDETNKKRSGLARSMSVSGGTISIINEGTGFGKSNNSYLSFLEYFTVPSNKNKVLVYTTPNKIQIDISKDHIARFKKRNIRILSLLSYEDLASPDFLRWENKQKTNKSYLSEITKEINSKLSKNIKFKKFINSLNRLNSIYVEIEFNIEAMNNAGDDDKDHYQQSIYKSRSKFHKQVNNTCQELFEIYDSIDSFYKDAPENALNILIDFIGFGFPLEVAKRKNCVILTTFSKFQTGVGYFKENRGNSEYKNTKEVDGLVNIIGHKKNIEDSISNITGKQLDRDYNQIKEDLFAMKNEDEDPFKNSIFYLVIDEEHESYNRHQDKNKSSLISSSKTKDTNEFGQSNSHTRYINVAHVMASIYRIFNSIVTKRQKAEWLHQEEKADFTDPRSVDEIMESEDILSDYEMAVLKLRDEMMKAMHNNAAVEDANFQDMLSNLSMFNNNVHKISVRVVNYSDVMKIAHNVFNFSGKQFLNEDELNKVFIGIRKNDNSRMLISTCKEDFSEGNQITLSFLFKLILSFMYAVNKLENKDIETIKSKGVDISHQNGGQHKKGTNQNMHLSDLIDNSTANKAFISHIFDNVSEDVLIDDIFTYIQPKNIISMVPADVQSDEPYTSVDFSMVCLKWLPEFDIIRTVVGTQNNVLLMSATGNMAGLFHGLYDKKFFQRINDQLDLKIKISMRYDEMEKISDIRKDRELNRGNRPVIKTISTSENCNAKYKEGNAYKETYRLINKNLESSKRGFYKTKEISTVCLAFSMAWLDFKNTMCLSISNSCVDLMKELPKNSSDFIYYEPEKGKPSSSVLLYSPANVNYRLKVILLNSNTAKKEPDILKKALTIEDKNEKVILISSFNSAGTGVNLCLDTYNTKSGDNFEKDFDRLFICGSPLYTEVIDHGTYNSVSNAIAILKNINAEGQDVFLSEISGDFVYKRDNFYFLRKSHDKLLLSKIFQAVGRVERRDSVMQTEIFFTDDFYKELRMQISGLIKEKNEILKTSSMLNNILVEHMSDDIENKSNLSDSEIKRFKDIKKYEFASKTFFEIGILNMLSDIRNSPGPEEAHKLMRIADKLRSEYSFRDPALLCKAIKNDPKTFSKYMGGVTLPHLSFFINNEDFSGLDLGINENNQIDLLKDSVIDYNIKNNIKSSFIDKKNCDEVVRSLFNEYASIIDNSFEKYSPQLPFLDTLKGNIGESIFIKVAQIEVPDIDFKQKTEDFLYKGSNYRFYEKFDFFVEHKNKLYCYDVKKWKNSFMKSRDLQALDSFHKKSNEIKNSLSDKYLGGIFFMVVNTEISNNESTPLDINFDGVRIKNLFVDIYPFNEKKRNRNDNVSRYRIEKSIFNDFRRK